MLYMKLTIIHHVVLKRLVIIKLQTNTHQQQLLLLYE